MQPRILYIEDNAEIREITSIILTRTGFNVTPAKNGLEALEYFNREIYDLIITDIFMPEMDGNRFIQRLAEVGNITPVLVLTYSVSNVVPNPLITLIVTKPLTSKDLREAVLIALSKEMVRGRSFAFAS